MIPVGLLGIISFMRRKDFTDTSPGELLQVDSEGFAFLPNTLPPALDWGKLVMALSEAERAVGELNGIGRRLPNPYLFTRPFLNREAVLSSRIEGTQASLTDLYALEAQTPLFEVDERREDAQEVQNYVFALEHGLKSELPISARLLREMHEVLMTDVWGRNRAPGEFRTVQNWIGPAGATRRDATYVPPPPGDTLNQAISDLERFIHDNNDMPALVEIALVHYQFEAIHPFLDGNGRIGRLLISLLFIQRGLLSEPLLYLSAYFERHRTAYYDHLLAISQRGTWEDWLTFFLRGVAQEANDAARRAQLLFDQHEAWRQQYQREGASANLLATLDQLIARPATTARRTEEALQVTNRSAQKIIDRLEQDGVLLEITGRARNRVYFAHRVLEIIDLPLDELDDPGEVQGPNIETGF